MKPEKIIKQLYGNKPITNPYFYHSDYEQMIDEGNSIKKHKSLIHRILKFFNLI